MRLTIFHRIFPHSVSPTEHCVLLWIWIMVRLFPEVLHIRRRKLEDSRWQPRCTNVYLADRLLEVLYVERHRGWLMPTQCIGKEPEHPFHLLAVHVNIDLRVPLPHLLHRFHKLLGRQGPRIILVRELEEVSHVLHDPPLLYGRAIPNPKCSLTVFYSQPFVAR